MRAVRCVQVVKDVEVYVCSVADALCVAAANHPSRFTPLPECFGCGCEVCVNCSSRRMYVGKRRRLCNNCQVDRLDDGDERVMARMSKMVDRLNKREMI